MDSHACAGENFSQVFGPFLHPFRIASDRFGRIWCALGSFAAHPFKIFLFQNEAKTSQTCSDCGGIKKTSRKTYVCKVSGCCKKDRDANAGKCIMMRAIIES